MLPDLVGNKSVMYIGGKKSSSLFLETLFKMIFVFQGFRTLEDIRTKAHLTNTQKIGLKHYDDLLDRMPREEAGAIEKVVSSMFFNKICLCLL